MCLWKFETWRYGRLGRPSKRAVGRPAHLTVLGPVERVDGRLVVRRSSVVSSKPAFDVLKYTHFNLRYRSPLNNGRLQPSFGQQPLKTTTFQLTIITILGFHIPFQHKYTTEEYNLTIQCLFWDQKINKNAVHIILVKLTPGYFQGKNQTNLPELLVQIDWVLCTARSKYLKDNASIFLWKTN